MHKLDRNCVSVPACLAAPVATRYDQLHGAEKNTIRSALFTIQGERCAYCERRTGTGKDEGHIEHFRDLIVTETLHFPQPDHLLLVGWQPIHALPYPMYHFFVGHLLVWVFIRTADQGSPFRLYRDDPPAAKPVQAIVSGCLHAVRRDIIPLRPFCATGPDACHDVLHGIFRFLHILQETQSKPIKFVFHGQNMLFERFD